MFSSMIPCLKLAGAVFNAIFWMAESDSETLGIWHAATGSSTSGICSADPFVTKKRNHGSLWEQNHQWCGDRHWHHEVPMRAKLSFLNKCWCWPVDGNLPIAFLKVSSWGFLTSWTTPCIEIFTDEDNCTLKCYFHEDFAFFTNTGILRHEPNCGSFFFNQKSAPFKSCFFWQASGDAKPGLDNHGEDGLDSWYPRSPWFVYDLLDQ